MLLSRHVPALFLAPLTCPDSHSIPIPARTWLVSPSSYVPGRPQLSHPGTYLACFSLFLRARIATALQSRHVTGMFPVLLTCPHGHSTTVPARTWHAYRSSYVPGRPQHSSSDTYPACFSLFLRACIATAFQARHAPGMLIALLTCLKSHSTIIPARNRLVSRSSYVPGQPQCSRPGTYLTCFSLFLRARKPTAFPARHVLDCFSLFLRARKDTALPSRHVPGLLLALLTCPERHSSPGPARNWLASRSSYVPG